MLHAIDARSTDRAGARRRTARGLREAATRRARRARLTPTPPRGATGRAECASGRWRQESRLTFHSTRPRPNRQRGRTGRYFEIASSATPFVRGPISPIAAITTAIAPAMNTNTPAVPKPFSTAAITNDVKIAEKRLHE